MAAEKSLLRQQTDRNRVNQRNFRARRHEYVRDLERRIRRFESEGLQVTREVQAIAQSVNNTNERLVWILESKFGVTKRQIDEYLRESNIVFDIEARSPLRQRRADRISASPKRSPRTILLTHDADRVFWTTAGLDQGLEGVSLVVEESQINRRLVQPYGCESALAIAYPTHGHSLQPTGLTPEVSPLRYHSTLVGDETVLQNQQDNIDRCSPRSGPRLDSVPENQPQYTYDLSEENTTDALTGETSCEEAASIIISVRGNNVHEEVWSELGCSIKQSCRVKTTSVFELLDRD
ncbi:hypothetical protein LTR84_003713 [Exophiala bonariae]|uniref:BZIP domain-containing protein n=1 Tax=Exophiala bonariae TaxID=1690606 RepID=A0AAV9N725_9EURO|nr:hypothetical protein LTR84_003713 [Exophiala bonariae]